MNNAYLLNFLLIASRPARPGPKNRRVVRARLRISKATLWRWIKDGKLTTVKLSERKIYVKTTEFERFIRESEK